MLTAADAALYGMSVVMAGVVGVWAWLLWSMVESHRKTPRLAGMQAGAGGGGGGGGTEAAPDREPAGGAAAAAGQVPRISVILPARNEERYVGRCLDSLAAQDYPDYEVVAVDDSSDDGTGRILSDRAASDPRIVHVRARPKPAGWMGKNWACMEGYARASGSLLLFTDADTFHSPRAMSLAAAALIGRGLDAFTVIPRLVCTDAWTRATLPVISTFLHTRFSALRVNDPTKKTGYFFGSFFIMRREAYEAVGTHEGVRGEIIEDGALGRRVKESGRPMMMALGDDAVDAVWARDRRTLWDALKRLMVPLYLQDRRSAAGVMAAVAVLLLLPFALLGASAAALAWGGMGAVGGIDGGGGGEAWRLVGESTALHALLALSLAASCMVYAGAAVEAAVLRVGLRYALLGPAGCAMVVLGFQAGMVQARRDGAVSWRGRSYSASDHAAGSGSIRV